MATSSSTLPEHGAKWTVQDKTSFGSLKLDEAAPLPKLGDHDVLVKMHAASLNYRDLIIANGNYPMIDPRISLVPGSDGSGEVVAVGPKVTRFQPGARVLTLFNQGHISGNITAAAYQTGLGGFIDGVLQTYGAWSEEGLVAMPSSLSYEEGATLPCAAVTAWNALYGLRAVGPGDTVLTQGTGGVSIFAVQFAKAAGATVIATTSSKEKADRLKQLGADHVINYKETPDWGSKAKALTRDESGVNLVIEVGGPNSFRQSMDCVAVGGTITVVGFLGGQHAENQPTFLESLFKQCTVRPVIVGSRDQFEEMNRAIEKHKIKPVVDQKLFKFKDLKDAFQYQWDQKHFGKVVVQIA